MQWPRKASREDLRRFCQCSRRPLASLNTLEGSGALCNLGTKIETTVVSRVQGLGFRVRET